MKRRKFISAFGTAIITAPFIGAVVSQASEPKSFEGHQFPGFDYNFNAFEPYIDAQTMEIHYSKHHRGYFEKFTAAAEGTKLVDIPLEQIFTQISEYPVTIRDNAGGLYNHTIFWENMIPAKIEVPTELEQALENDFGSIDAFKEQFGTAAKTLFGSGWAWLILHENGKMAVATTHNQDNPLMNIAGIKRGLPLLGIDVWEHAYYLNYQNNRADYVDNFWNIVNWDVVNYRLHQALV